MSDVREPDPKDVAEAEARFRRYEAGENPAAIYGKRWDAQVRVDICILACAYLDLMDARHAAAGGPGGG